MPSSFIQHIKFIHQAHQLTLHPHQPQPTLHPHQPSQPTLHQLPRLQRQTNKQSKQNQSLIEIRNRATHKINKSNSMLQLDQNINSDIFNFRKQFVLGFYNKQIITSTHQYQKNKILQQPKGYFQLKTIKLDECKPQEMKRRQWACYIQAKSQQKQRFNKKNKGNLKIHLYKQNHISPSKKQSTFKDIFNKYSNLPSITTLNKKNNLKIGKFGSKNKQISFIHPK